MYHQKSVEERMFLFNRAIELRNMLKTNRSIAERLSMPLSTLKWILKWGRKNLREKEAE